MSRAIRTFIPKCIMLLSISGMRSSIGVETMCSMASLAPSSILLTAAVSSGVTVTCKGRCIIAVFVSQVPDHGRNLVVLFGLKKLFYLSYYFFCREEGVNHEIRLCIYDIVVFLGEGFSASGYVQHDDFVLPYIS